MSRNPPRGSLRAVSWTLSTVLVLLLPATPALAAECAFDAGTHTLTVTNDDVVGVRIENAGGDLEVDDVVCAAIADLDTVIVDMAEMVGTLHLELQGGPLGPGFTTEGDGSSELEFEVIGLDTGVEVIGSSSTDVLSAGQRSTADGILRELNLNVLADAGNEDVDVTVHGDVGDIMFRGEDGDDELTGTGTGTPGSEPLAYRINLDDGDGSDFLVGGNGPDQLFVDLHDEGADEAFGGPGLDLVAAFAEAGQDNDVSLDNVNNDGTSCFLGLCDDDNIASDIEQVFGFSANDRFTGGPGDQLLSGADGNDQLFGGGGNDELFGDAGVDLMAGGAGNDTLWDGQDGDIFLGGTGFDTANFSRMFFGVTVTLDGLANDGEDNVDTDIERLIGTLQTDRFEGGPGRQVLIGLGDSDILEGGGGPDLLRGGAGDDSLGGGPGADTLVGGTGQDRFVGGSDLDTVSYQASSAGVVVSIDGLPNDGVVGEHDDVERGVERVIGSPFDDRLRGNDRPNTLRGGDGDDVLRGFGGSDLLYGESGNDTLDGGIGTDLCKQGPGTGTKTSCER